jgi:hypothetical protein
MKSLIYLITTNRKVGIALHKYQPGPGHGPVLSYLNAAMLNRAVDPHPLLACEMWDPKVSFVAPPFPQVE